ncbi:MAG: MBOAT family protein [Lachnospiraceae bacterium]|nr:MBOAT family protein [Lachnospiraceae bacterium]
MIFSSTLFLFVFLPLTLGIYYIVPRKGRNIVILLASLLFYFWGEQVYFAIMIFSTLVDFTHGLLVEHFLQKEKHKAAKAVVASSIILNLGILFFFKYWDFIAANLENIGFNFMPILNIHLPIGISFFTFQTMSYTIDVYRGDARAQRKIINFGTFVTLFPQLIAGPIIKYKNIGNQIDERIYSLDKFVSGINIFSIGLAKKVLLANNIGLLWETIKETPLTELTVVGVWIGVIAFSLQIYFDFSGYSDMAIGLGKMLGFEFLPNFNYPYISKSITEFWRRWHISLSTWFREYLYIPLGGNRCCKYKWIRNLFIVWSCTGLWHGASWNYLFWGLYFFTILLIEKLFLSKILYKIPTFFQHCYTIFLILISWTIFALEDTAQLIGFLKKMFFVGGASFVDTNTLYYLGQYLPLLCIGFAASTPIGKRFIKKATVLKPILLIIGLLLCTAYLVADTYNPFLYFRF